MDKQQEYVLRSVEERDVRFIRLWFTDVLGVLKSVAIAPAELENAFEEGIGFDGSAVEGLTRVYEADMIARPDPTTFQILPWRGDVKGAVAAPAPAPAAVVQSGSFTVTAGGSLTVASESLEPWEMLAAVAERHSRYSERTEEQDSHEVLVQLLDEIRSEEICRMQKGSKLVSGAPERSS